CTTKLVNPQQLPFSDHSRSAEVKILLPAAPSGAAFLLLVSNKPLKRTNRTQPDGHFGLFLSQSRLTFSHVKPLNIMKIRTSSFDIVAGLNSNHHHIDNL
ncbi:hypothetical protein, partial [Vibrio cholerae]